MSQEISSDAGRRTYSAFYQDDHSVIIYRRRLNDGTLDKLPRGAKPANDSRSTYHRTDGGDRFEFALDAQADGGALGVIVAGFVERGVDVAVGDAAGAEVSGDAVFALAANFGALANELFGVAVVVDHAVFFEAGHDYLCEELVVGATGEEFFHFGDGVRAAHQRALRGFVELRLRFEFAGPGKHGSRIALIDTAHSSSRWGHEA